VIVDELFEPAGGRDAATEPMSAMSTTVIMTMPAQLKRRVDRRRATPDEKRPVMGLSRGALWLRPVRRDKDAEGMSCEICVHAQRLFGVV
jgi:hypothetical protein